MISSAINLPVGSVEVPLRGYFRFGIKTANGGQELDNNQALNHFLLSVEKRALRMATISTGSIDEALDIVQDAMLKLTSRYGNRDDAEWGGLFHRILQNLITDWHRRSRLRNLWQRFSTPNDASGDAVDVIQTMPDQTGQEPVRHLQGDEAIAVLDTAIHLLPLRQQQAFMLRLWEGLSVADTAAAMGCSQGSVKTHYSRALKALREQLEGHWP